MNPPKPGNTAWLDDKAFLWLIVAVSLIFFWIIAPLHGAILWAVVIAIVFAPLNRRLRAAMRNRPNLAAITTLIVIIVIVILPLTVLITSLVTEATDVYDRMQSGELNLGRYLQRIFDSMPNWATELRDRLGLSSLEGLKQKLTAGLSETSKVVAVHALRVGQNTFNFFLNLFVMLYLLFFVLRDGDELARRIKEAIPLRAEHQRALVNKFIVVIRATIKGNMVIAILQGALGGLIFWILRIQAPLLWGALMTILSLLPAVGAAVIWLPVAIYLLAAGEVAKGIILLLFGGVVISLVDNLVRPILVGKDTKMPDYVVLISTLGGIAAFGVNGFVIGPVIASMFISVWDIFASSKTRVVQPGAISEK
jgi:predicted PurR-regulated permease PerM